MIRTFLARKVHVRASVLLEARRVCVCVRAQEQLERPGGQPQGQSLSERRRRYVRHLRHLRHSALVNVTRVSESAAGSCASIGFRDHTLSQLFYELF